MRSFPFVDIGLALPGLFPLILLLSSCVGKPYGTFYQAGTEGKCAEVALYRDGTSSGGACDRSKYERKDGTVFVCENFNSTKKTAVFSFDESNGRLQFTPIANGFPFIWYRSQADCEIELPKSHEEPPPPAAESPDPLSNYR